MQLTLETSAFILELKMLQSIKEILKLRALMSNRETLSISILLMCQ